MASRTRLTVSLCPVPTFSFFFAAHQGPFRDLIRSTSRLVLDHGGAVRGLQYWGRRVLPQRARRHQQWHTEGE